MMMSRLHRLTDFCHGGSRPTTHMDGHLFSMHASSVERPNVALYRMLGQNQVRKRHKRFAH